MRPLQSFCVVFMYFGTGFGESIGLVSISGQDSNGHRYGGTYELKDGEMRQLFGFPGLFGFMEQPLGSSLFGGNNAMNFNIPDFFRSFGNMFKSTMGATRRMESFEPFKPLEFWPPFQMRMQPIRFKPFKPLEPLDFGEPFHMLMEPIRFKPFKSIFDNNNEPSGAPEDSLELPGDFGMGTNSAFTSGAIMSGLVQQPDAMSSSGNPNSLTGFSISDGTPQMKSVVSSSYSSSMNVNGKPVTHRAAETLVNDNGHITDFKLVI